MDVRRTLVCVLLVCFAVNLVPAAALAAGRDTAVIAASLDAAPTSAIDFRAAARDAVATLEAPSVAPPAAATAAATSTTSSAARRRQGTSGMILGLVSMVAGLAVTVYMIKEMKKDKDPVE